jgi:hypothetical protein
MAIGDHFWNSIPEWETIGIQVTNPKHGKGIWDVTRHPQRAREAQAAGIIRVAWENGETNIADLLTKLMPGPRLKELVGYVLW